MIMSFARLPLLLFACLLFFPALTLASDCFSCHEQSNFSNRVVHAPVAKGECGICHSPHVSKHKGLLRQQEAKLCFSCHDEVLSQIESKQYQHMPVKQGRCSECHAPHASANEGLLNKDSSELCYSCHETSVTDFKFPHKPFQQGQCSACHTAHASDDDRLLKRSGSALCLGCHQSTAGLKKSHLGRELKTVDCLSCHNPHGSADRSLLRAVQHRPFAQKNCVSCHVREDDTNLCLDCHKETLASFNAVHSHIGVGGAANACTVCHNPHVGDRPGLLPTNEGRVCRSCHRDTFAKRDQMLHQHQDWNLCSNCHFGHGGNSPAMLKNGREVCYDCHDQHKGFSHPMGEEALDPRNSKPMDCITCHNANEGSMFKHFLHGSGERGLCVQCHQSY